MYELSTRRKGGTRTIAVRGQMTVYSAAELKRELLAKSAGADVRLDLDAVSDFDTAGAQLLLLLGREARAAGHALALGPCSAAVREALATLGLAAALDGATPLEVAP